MRGRPSGWRCYRPAAITAPCLSGTWYAAWCTPLLSQPCVRNTRKWKSISRIFALACSHAECMHILTNLSRPLFAPVCLPLPPMQPPSSCVHLAIVMYAIISIIERVSLSRLSCTAHQLAHHVIVDVQLFMPIVCSLTCMHAVLVSGHPRMGHSQMLSAFSLPFSFLYPCANPLYRRPGLVLCAQCL